MEIIRINKEKLKVMLSDEDMRHYEIQSCGTNYSDSALRRALGKILVDADTESDFNIAKDRIYVEIFPDKCGGCEMFVTKIGEREKKDSRAKTPEKRWFLYIFPDLATLLLVAKKLFSLDYTEESFAYKDEKSNYCLLLYEKTGNGLSAEKSISEFSFLTEYGKRKSGTFSIAYLREHGWPIGGRNAVALLSEL